MGLLMATASCGSEDGDGGGGSSGSERADAGAVVDVSDQGDPVDGGEITVGLEAETNSWLPGTANFGNPGYNVAYAIYDPLMKRTPDGGVEPYLAESMEPNEDLTEWTLKLRPDVTFHDGTPLNAQALKTIWDEYLVAPGSNLASNLAEVTSLDVVDDLTVKYTLKAPNAAFPDLLSDPAGWPFSPTAAAAAGDDAGSNPVGTGPFEFVSWQRDNALVVEKYEDYWQEGLPHLDKITFRPIPDEDTRLSSLQSGDIDAMQSLRQSTVDRARDVEGVDNYEFLGNNSGGSNFNTARPPFDDLRVRKALALALDQEALIEVLGGSGLTPPSTQFFGPDDPFWSEEAAEAWPANDPEKAQEFYDDYINDPTRSDGKPVGEPISFTYTCPPDPSLNELSQLYQSFWNALGMQVELEAVEQAAYVQQVVARDYDAGCTRHGGARDPYYVFQRAFTPGVPNVTEFTDPVIDANLAIMRETTDVEERKAAAEAISLVLAENVPVTFTGGTLTVVAVDDAVKNVDGWVFPDGSEGNGTPDGTAMWGHVWKAE
ncbi:ABC transporter substrate-binding protein [Blastococcus goldschmidtiae]|uniref:ABC transporter substrate-binding protein n=1 Tax=Blastococcus goldschmidtiae TaxID=3075546 RepID=A0ABU2K558_9ACTN|nr:ABC transporter substrate-binding protein [Blastococcus sp. DSM 46792]MDT0275298.1 ABC transporter substrate-binding protein [Blastococcus sp. DSM 46792]